MPFPAPSRQPPRRLPYTPRYPVWCAKSIALVSLLTTTLIATLVFLLGHQSLLVETEIALALVSLVLFLFLSFGLYHGIRIKKQSLQPPLPDGQQLVESLNYVDIPDLDALDCDTAGDGCLETLTSLLLSLLAALALAALAWLLINLVWGLFAVLALALFWLFHRALRQTFARSRACRGRLARSLTFALYHTLLYTAWLFALLHVIQYLHARW